MLPTQSSEDLEKVFFFLSNSDTTTKLGIVEWLVSPSSLEDVFLNVVSLHELDLRRLGFTQAATNFPVLQVPSQ